MRGVKGKLSSPRHPDETFVLGCLTALVQVFSCYGFEWTPTDEPKVIDNVIKTYKLFEGSGMPWMKYFKTRIADFFSSWMDSQELSGYPYGEHENPRYLFGGSFYRFTRSIMKTERGASFCTSILMSKKGMPVADEKMLAEAALESYVTMTSEKEPVQPYVHRTQVLHYDGPEGPILEETIPHHIGRQTIEYEIRRSVREVFRHWSFTLEDMARPVLPSTSSNYNRTRTKMGTYGELENRSKSFQRMERELYHGRNWTKYELRPCPVKGRVSAYYDERADDDEFVLDEDPLNPDVVPGLCVDTAGFKAVYRRAYWGLVNEAMEEEPLVEVVPLAEKLKIRCISKGPPITYFVLKTLQQSLHSHLRRNKVFSLIGEPISEDFFNERFSQYIGKGYRFHSGDYRGATDNLYAWASETVALELSEMFKEKNGYGMGDYLKLFLRSLTGHIYTRCEGDRYYADTQKRGQLMGSITSFPVLCVLNFTLMRMSLEISEDRPVSLQNFPGVINGDDCFTPYHKGDFPRIWESIAKQFGFEKSLGKTYDSATFGSMNSHTFVVEGESWKLVKYINLGLLTRDTWVEDKYKAPPSELGVLHRKLVETSPPSLQKRMSDFFIYTYRETLDSFKGPWFLPTYMGGLGMVQLEEYTDKDRHFGYHALQEAAVNPVRLRREKEWFHQDLLNLVVEIEGGGLVTERSYMSYEGEETYGEAYIAIVWEGWLEVGVKVLDNAHLTEDDLITKSLIAFNRRVLRRIEADHKAGGYHRVKSDRCFEEVRRASVVPLFTKGGPVQESRISAFREWVRN
jgi:hypothetical protein